VRVGSIDFCKLVVAVEEVYEVRGMQERGGVTRSIYMYTHINK